MNTPNPPKYYTPGTVVEHSDGSRYRLVTRKGRADIWITQKLKEDGTVDDSQVDGGITYIPLQSLRFFFRRVP